MVVIRTLSRGKRVVRAVRERESFILMDFVNSMDEMVRVRQIIVNRRCLAFTMKGQVNRLNTCRNYRVRP